jgi:hypothetical protein
MKQIIILFLLFTTVGNVSGFGIVNNSGSLPSDSLSIPFYALDSVGNMTSIENGDSVYLVVYYPSGALAFQDSSAYNGSKITSYVRHGYSWYSWKEAIADIDGTPVNGLYSYILTVKDLTSASIVTPHSGFFQLTTESDFYKSMEYLKDIIDSIQSHDNWIAKENSIQVLDDSIDVLDEKYISIIDSLLRVLDTLDSYKGRWDSVLSAIDDKTAFKANFDSQSVAGWVWNAPQNSYTTSGTFGDYLDADISGLGAGSGAYSYKIITYDSSSNQTINQISIAIRNLNQTSLIATGVSDLNGELTFNLDADSFLVVTTSSGYIFDSFDTIVVTSGSIDTVFGYPFDAGQPVSPELCRVYGFLYDINGIPESGATVTAGLPGGVVSYNDIIVSPFQISTLTDSLGYFYLDLIPSDSLTPIDQLYEFTISRSDGTILRQRMEVPDSVSWQLNW